jgi:hypothetical protein
LVFNFDTPDINNIAKVEKNKNGKSDKTLSVKPINSILKPKKAMKIIISFLSKNLLKPNAIVSRKNAKNAKHTDLKAIIFSPNNIYAGVSNSGKPHG